MLEGERVGIHDSFFELGGHSLLAIRLIAALRRVINKEMPIQEIFTYPTLAGLCGRLEEAGGLPLMPAIDLQERPAYIPLSFSQERLWFIDRLQGSRHYHMYWAFRLTGALDRQGLEAAFRAIVDRHEVLRTFIREQEGVGYQHIGDANDWTLTYRQQAGILAGGDTLTSYLEDFALRPFDLSADFPLRVEVITLGEQEHLMAAAVHHIAFDGWSISILVAELVELYRSRQEQRPARLTALPVQYADYALWQRKYLSGDRLQEKLDYWRQQLRGVEPLPLPTDYERPASVSTRGGQ